MTDQKVNTLDERFPTHVKHLLDQIIKKEGFISYSTTYKTIISTENNLGNLKEIDIQGKTKDGEKYIYLFLKLPPQVNLVFCTTEEIFERESYAYTQLFKIYEELQDNAGIPDEIRLKTVKCFDGSHSEAIILENLSRKGYKTLPKMEVIPLVFAEQSIKQLAIFHALSIVLQKQKPVYFESKVMKRLKYLASDSTKHVAVIRNMFENTNKQLSEENQKHTVVLMDTYRAEVKKHLKTSNIFKCLCHGDFKKNNLLYKEQDCGRTEVIMIDYQGINYGSPANDFIFFIFLETDREFRRKHLEHLKNLYYSKFEEFLTDFDGFFNLDLNGLWSREEFENQFQEGLHLGLIHCIAVFPYIFSNPDDTLDLEDIKVIAMKQVTIDRLQGLVDDFIEWRGLSCSSENGHLASSGSRTTL